MKLNEVLTPSRVITFSNSGGARIAAEALAVFRNQNLILLDKEHSIISKILLFFMQYLFRKVGEDYIFPVTLSSGDFYAQENDELHWLVGCKLNIDSLKNKNVTLYMHDLWWTTGFNCYPALKNEFEFCPYIFRRTRSSLRERMLKACNRKMLHLAEFANLVCPTDYLKGQVDTNFRHLVKVDKSQFEIMSMSVNKVKKRKTKKALGFAPKGSSYRKGSDETIQYIVNQANNHPDLQYTLVSNHKLTGLARNIDIIKQTTHVDFLTLLAQHEQVVFLTRNDNLPNVLIEATALGLEVLTTKQSGFKEVVKDFVDVKP